MQYLKEGYYWKYAFFVGLMHIPISYINTWFKVYENK